MRIFNYEALLDKVQKPTRYLGKEINAVYKPPGDAAVHFALAFPDLYEVMSHLGLKILYSLSNTLPGICRAGVCTRQRYGRVVAEPNGSPFLAWRPERLFMLLIWSVLPFSDELCYTAILNCSVRWDSAAKRR